MPAEGADGPPDLPVDAWGAVARAALHQEGNGVQAWARLSLVNGVWRAGLQGAHMTVEQRARLFPSCRHMDGAAKAKHAIDGRHPCLNGLARGYKSNVLLLTTAMTMQACH